MHLDILYKQVTFITPQKIASILPGFKEDKMQKQKEEEERIQMQNQMKKSRGRQSTKKERKEDVTMEDGESKAISPIANKKVIKTELKL